MIKKIILLTAVFVLFSCDYIQIKKKSNKKEKTGRVVAVVYDQKLYAEDIYELIPNKIMQKDSLALAKSLVNSWASQQIFMKKSQENLSKENNTEIEKLVEEYRKSLYINRYKEKLIKQQLDTIVSEQAIEDYFVNNKENFRVKLNQELVQIKFIHFGKNFVNKKEVIKQFKSDKEEDLESLEEHSISFISSRLRNPEWIGLQKFKDLVPPLKKTKKEELLKKTKFIKKEDSLGVYLVSITNVLKINDLAPISYVSPSIKQLIIHKRKLELIREIEKTFIKDAVKNKNFEEY